MENKTKENLDYEQELLEWENCYLRLHKLISQYTDEKWVKEIEYLEAWWIKMQGELKKIYGVE